MQLLTISDTLCKDVNHVSYILSHYPSGDLDHAYVTFKRQNHTLYKSNCSQLHATKKRLKSLSFLAVLF